jgi:hypothetical protein
MKNKPTNPRPPSSQFEATIVIFIVSSVQAEAAIRSWPASTWSAHLAHRDTRELYRRVVVPSAELLREGLPEPQV